MGFFLYPYPEAKIWTKPIGIDQEEQLLMDFFIMRPQSLQTYHMFRVYAHT